MATIEGNGNERASERAGGRSSQPLNYNGAMENREEREEERRRISVLYVYLLAEGGREGYTGEHCEQQKIPSTDRLPHSARV